LNTQPIIKPVQIISKYGKQAFSDREEVKLKSESVDTEIRYTMDGSEPNEKELLYTKPITINESTTIKAAAFKDGKKSIVTREARFYKIKKYKSSKLLNKPSPKYPSQGEFTLFDGIRGSRNFRDGNWLGFEGDNFELTIDFGIVESVNKIRIGLLQDVNSWIFLPLSVVFAMSRDGESFTEIGSFSEREIKISITEPIGDVIKNFDTLKTRYLKIYIQNMGLCPPGHAGAGKKAWLFVDEIIVE
jgi:hexosaminidase